MSKIPAQLQDARDSLLTAINNVRMVDTPANEHDLQRAIERFAEAFSADPKGAAELTRRAESVAQLTGPGTVYNDARLKAFVLWRNQLLVRQRWVRLGRSVTYSISASDALGAMREKRFLAAQLSDEQLLIKGVLLQTWLTTRQRNTLEAWLHESEAVESQAWPLEPDGCWYITHPDYVMFAPDEKLPIGDHILEEIKRAAASLVEWWDEQMHGCRHSKDFRSVKWCGQSYLFTKSQALCVKVMWEASQQGTPEMEGLTILTDADAAGTRLIDVFRKHPAWGTMIVKGGTKGAYRLAPDLP